MQVLILAGGLGTRIKSLTKEQIPKALIPVNNIPFAEYQMKHLANQNITNIVYSIGFLGEQIRSFVGNGSKWGVHVTYVDEGKELMGTGGAIRKAIDAGGMESDFFVLYGDAFLPVYYQPIYETYLKMNLPGLMAVYKNNGNWDTSNTELEGPLVSFYTKDKKRIDRQKPSYIDYGLSVYKRDYLLDHIPKGEKYDLSKYQEYLVSKNLLAGFEVFERFYEVGSEKGLADFERYLQNELTP